MFYKYSSQSVTLEVIAAQLSDTSHGLTPITIRQRGCVFFELDEEGYVVSPR